ncbi:MAG: septum formation initiator family protein [Clostridia bacterium]|nr:septum formation initiator family protein [Clostridia bacterium]MBR5976257.1 septum formation initiator family protein [Clostridia bacterium]MBR5992043.1 septum formation initiator family protein [Clostridia bacterium]MBR6479707.1 septum formation initiator family protein [Clostridia bacterium]MBR6512001.1 septum formation initiator family protein [Clostridia bacterium]
MAKQKTNEKTDKKTRSTSFFLTLAIIVVIGYFVISLVSLQMEKNEKAQQVAQAKATLAEKQEKNDQLSSVLEDGDDSAYIERIARDVLGYVLPGERVYYDISSGN